MTSAALLLLLTLADAADEPVLVVPPDGPADAATSWVGATVAESLPRALQRAGVPAVPDTDRRRTQETLGVPSAATTRATSIRVAEALGSSRLVVGSWEPHGSAITLSLRLLDANRGTLSAPITAAAPLGELGVLVQSLAWDVALAGPRPSKGSREALVRQAASASSDTLKRLGLGLVARDAAARLREVRLAVAQDPACEEAALLLARLLVDTSAFAEARTVLARIPGQSVFGREARFLEGVALLGLARYREADSLYAELAQVGLSAAVLSNRAVARLRLGNSGKGASTLLRQAVEAEPASIELPLNLGWALLVEGEAPASAFWLRGAVRRDPSDAQARLLLSWALAAIPSAAEAEEQWNSAVALAPTLSGMRTADTSRKLERIFASEYALVLDPERHSDAEASRNHAARGEALLDGRDLAGAVAELTRASLLDPFAAKPHRLLARARRAQKDDVRAIEELRMALWCREDPAVRGELASLLRATGRIEEARRVQD